MKACKRSAFYLLLMVVLGSLHALAQSALNLENGFKAYRFYDASDPNLGGSRFDSNQYPTGDEK